MIGRERELAAVQRLLLQAESGVLTLTGPGGIGKTRLALQVAANLLDHFVNGVYVVALAPLRDPELVSTAIVQTLRVRETPGRSTVKPDFALTASDRASIHDDALRCSFLEDVAIHRALHTAYLEANRGKAYTVVAANASASVG